MKKIEFTYVDSLNRGFMERKILSKLQFAFVFVLILLQSKVFAQIGAPTFVFTQMCAEPPPYPTNFNDFTINFTFSGSGTYVLEMSDANGSFLTSPLPSLTIISSQTTTSPGSFNFRLPSNLVGSDKYKFRIKNTATSPATAGPSSGAVPNPDPNLPGRTGISAYYKSFIEDFSINNGVSTLYLCGSGSINLIVDPTTPGNPSPLDISPALKYRWYKDDVVVAGQTGSSLTVNTPGTYQAFIEYGPCTTLSSFYCSKKVQVVASPTGQTFTITSSGGTNICPSNPTTLSVQSGYTYQWYLNDVAIAGATSNTYVTAQSGTYKVVIGQGSCATTSNTITLTAETFNTTLDVVLDPGFNFIDDGEVKLITATTDAVSPIFEWYIAGNPTPLSTTNTLSTSLPGKYTLKVTQTGASCNFPKEYHFTIKIGIDPVDIPNTISPNGDEVNDTWIIPQEYIAENVEVFIVDSYGKEVLKTKNYENNWPQTTVEFKSVNPVFYYIISKDGSAVKKGSITIIK